MPDIQTKSQKKKSLPRLVLFFLELEVLRLLPLPWIFRWLNLRARWTHSRGQMMSARGLSRKRRHRASPGLPKIEADQLNEYLKYLLMNRDASQYPALLIVDGWDHVEEGRRSDKGVVFLTSHVGIPRLLRWYTRSLRDCEFCHVYKLGKLNETKGLRARLLRWGKARHGVNEEGLIGDEPFSAQYMKKAFECLRRNGVVNISGDGQRGDRRVPVEIRGREYQFPAGGVALGRMSGAAILPCFTIIEPGPRFRIQIQAPLQCPPGLSAAEETAALVRSFAARIEDYARKYPEASRRFGRPGRNPRSEPSG